MQQSDFCIASVVSSAMSSYVKTKRISIQVENPRRLRGLRAHGLHSRRGPWDDSSGEGLGRRTTNTTVKAGIKGRRWSFIYSLPHSVSCVNSNMIRTRKLRLYCMLHCDCFRGMSLAEEIQCNTKPLFVHNNIKKLIACGVVWIE